MRQLVMSRTTPNTEILYQQHRVKGINPVLEFGPLQASLQDIMNTGYRLEAVAPFPRRAEETIKIYLTKGAKRFLYGHVNRVILEHADDLSIFRRRADRMITHCQIHFIPDLWKTLEERYPNRAKPVKVGNHTLREYVEERLST